LYNLFKKYKKKIWFLEKVSSKFFEPDTIREEGTQIHVILVWEDFSNFSKIFQILCPSGKGRFKEGILTLKMEHTGTLS
jgi:hypothetical protein